MPTPPNPATTEWVPLWDLNGGSGSSGVRIGSWIPVIGGVPPEGQPHTNEGEINQYYQFQQGLYFKIDKFVYLWSYTQFGQVPNPQPGDNRNGKGTITGHVAVKGFPFTVSSSAPVSMFFSGVNSYFSNMLTPTGKLSLTFYTSSGTTYGRIKQLIQNDNPEPLFDVDLNNNTQLVFAVAYLTDDL